MQKHPKKGLRPRLNDQDIPLIPAVALAEIQTELGRAGGALTRAWKTVHNLNQHQEKALQYFEEKDPSFTPEKPVQVEPESAPEMGAAPPKPSPSASFSVSPRLATFTMVAILRNQGLGEQALEVLNMLEAKGEDLERITKERIAIQGETNE